MVWSRDNNPQDDSPIINVFGNLHIDLVLSLDCLITYIQQQ
jgi:hypothetical protein